MSLYILIAPIRRDRDLRLKLKTTEPVKVFALSIDIIELRTQKLGH